jgi:putative ATP-dependent endonuclease of the OLD family
LKLEKLILKNFRGYRDIFEITFEDITAIIAKNDVGKSSLLDSLNSFFNLDKLEAGDRSVGCASSEDIEITCIFTDLPDELIVDTDHLISPPNEHLLNVDGRLEVKKVFSGASPKCESVILKAYHPTVDKYDDLFDLNITKLRTRATELGIDMSNVNNSVKSSIRHAIWESVEPNSLSLQEKEIEIIKTIWKSIQNILPLFKLFKSDRPSSDQDAEAQEPIKFAIEEALKSKGDVLNEIGSFVEEQVKEVTEETIRKLKEMDENLANQLDPKFSKINWSKVFSVSLTNENQIPLNKRGSGVRRLFLINFFRARAEQVAKGRDVNDVIFAIEEPETSQHPSNQILLLRAFQELASESNNQVILTTHNPPLVSQFDVNQIRLIEIDDTGRRILLDDDHGKLKKAKETLGMFANHNIKVFVGVEGPNDIEFLKRISDILSNDTPDIVSFTECEKEGALVFIPMGGSTLQLWTNRLEELSIPEVHILDRDNAPPEAPKYQSSADAVNARGDNCIAFTTTKREMENYINYEAINEELGTSFPEHFKDFDDVPMLTAKAVHELSESETPWDDLTDEKRSEKESKVKKRLNRVVLDRMTDSRLKDVDADGDVVGWLSKISSYLIGAHA